MFNDAVKMATSSSASFIYGLQFFVVDKLAVEERFKPALGFVGLL